MISIIPEREILKSFTDKNINGPASKIRVDSFESANRLLSYNSYKKVVEIIIEGRLFGIIKDRLEKPHIDLWRFIYKIDESAVGVQDYNITRAIKFITDSKIKTKRKVIILTENPQNYTGFDSTKVISLKPSEFNSRFKIFEDIKEDYTTTEDAIISAFFFCENQ